MDTLAFWLPLFLLFFSALVGAVLKRRSCDHCLKKFEGSEILIPFDNQEWTCGKLSVFAQGIEVEISGKIELNGGRVLAKVLHSTEVDKIPYFVRQAPDPDTRKGMIWKNERKRLLHPPFLDRVRRSSLNSYNMLRDSFGQALKAILGSMSKDTKLGKTRDADKRLHEMQTSLTGLVPNSWEPILEKYRGKCVAIEREVDSVIISETGILEDYSNKYILLRDVHVSESVLADHLDELTVKKDRACDILYSRSHALLRYSIRLGDSRG